MKEYLINGKQFRLNLFEKIENKEQAYLIGYLTGDGGFNPPTHKRLARLYVSSNNESIIQGFKEEFCPDSIISSKIPVNNSENYNIVSNKLSYVLNFSSKFSETFNKFGVLGIKKNRTLVNISKKFMRQYILGLFDADGHISFGFRKDRNRLWGNFGITHQSYDVLSKVQKFLNEELNIASSILTRKDEDCMDLKFSKLDSVVKVLDWLYEDTPNVYNEIKYQHFLKFKKAHSEK